jgi:hypothetical protein
MVTRISNEARRALEAMDWVERGIPENTQEQVKLLLECNRIIKLLSIGATLTEGWGKFIYNEAVKRFGDDADYKFRETRREIFKSLANRGDDELKRIPERLRINILESSMADIEQPTRPVAAGLFEKLFNLEEYRSLKMNFFSSVPLNVLSAGEGKNVFSVGNFYIDKDTADLFVGKNETSETMEVVGEAISYVRSTKTNWENFGELRGRKKAALYAKNLYKLFHKNLKEEALDIGLDKIINYFNEGRLVKGLIGLRNHPEFAPTIKNMTNVVVVEFGKGMVEIYTSGIKGNFYFDDISAANIRKSIRKYEGIGAAYIFAMNMMLNYFTAVMTGMERNVYDDKLRLCKEARGKNEPGARNEIQSIFLNASSIASFEDMVWIESKKPVGQAKVGINIAEIVLPETRRRLNIGFFQGIPENIGLNSFLYSDATLVYPETGVMDYNILTSPEIDLLFSSIKPSDRFDAGLADRLNAIWPPGLKQPPFKYVRGRFDSMVCSLTADVNVGVAKARSSGVKKR